jgi:hypothetical protein
VQLQQSVPDLQKRGLGLAAISYDPPATLKAFADQRGITFPLLSDAGSATIKQYSLLNAEAAGRFAGIPYPGTFVVDARGVVVTRSFEEAYQERASAASLLARGAAPGTGVAGQKADTRHLTLTASVSDPVVAPGTRFSLVIDVTPKPKMHVYSPEQTTYIPIALTLEPNEALKVHAPSFPKAETYVFEPLKETQLVFSRPFRIVQDVTVPFTPALRTRALQAGATLTITGTLRYQACDDTVCYLPATVPLTWKIPLRSPEK